MLAVAMAMAAAPMASAETRTLKLYFTHTKERAEITYKRNGRYLQSGLDKLNRFLRDWRRDEPTDMDPRLMDVLWEVYRASGSRDHIHVISAYRAPETNTMLRKRSSGVAKKSQHTLGKAIDFYLPDVKISKLRSIALRKQDGGVGYYPASGSPFVHVDVGSVRHWPRMGRQELMALFPDGKSLHVPTDGKPLPGYEQALAAYESRKRNGGNVQVADDSSGSGNRRGLLAALFGRGGGADEEEDSAQSAQVAAANSGQGQAQQPEPESRAETPETILAALPERSLPVPRAAPRPDVDVGAEESGEMQAAALIAAAKADDAPADARDEMTVAALDVPLPTRRPKHAPASGDGDAPEDARTAVAEIIEDAETGREDAPSDAVGEMIAARDRNTQIAAAAYLPVPSARPEPDDARFDLASTPSERVTNDSGVPGLADASSTSQGAAAKSGRPTADSPRLALLDEQRNADPAAIFKDVGTTTKSARPGPEDRHDKRKPIVRPVETGMSGRSLSRSSMMTTSAETRAPSFGFSGVRAPTEVYTGGFQQESTVADARRFSGKAVTFLSVAKFATN